MSTLLLLSIIYFLAIQTRTTNGLTPQRALPPLKLNGFGGSRPQPKFPAKEFGEKEKEDFKFPPHIGSPLVSNNPHHDHSYSDKNDIDHNDVTDVREEEEYATIASSCNDIGQNGLYYIKPTEDGPVIPVICSDGYTMLDASLDFEMNSLSYYLSSWDYGRIDNSYLISRLDDLSTFREWWTPSDENTKFRVAVDCDVCTEGEFGDNTVYYIDSHTFCFSADPSNGCSDKMSEEYHKYACNTCDVGEFPNDDDLWTKCYALQMNADSPINHDHITCVAHGLTFHPTLSNIRDACTCYQPTINSDQTASFQVLISELPLVTSNTNALDNVEYIDDLIQFDPVYADEDDSVFDARDTNIVYLSQSDFVSGTYRIRESGTYILSEDIVFNFNAPTQEEMDSDSFSANSIDNDELYWFPTREQSMDNDQYPGLYQFAGSFTLGFFAGITIECEYVKLDLNDHTLSQDYVFYFQQRFFSLIELASQPFVPGQGPANWGAGTDKYAANVEITNGNLGLTSHHGIHGNNNAFVNINNVNVHSFDVAGIQCNGCNDVIVSDVSIGPQNINIPVLGRYVHARAMLPRLQQFAEAHGDEMVTYVGRDSISVNSLVDRMILQMDMIYNYIIKGVEYDDEDDYEWIATKKLFYNPSGWMDGGSSYGLVFSGQGAAVVGIGSRIKYTGDITIQNVEISGIYNKVIEKVKFTASAGATRLIFFDAIDWMAVSDQIVDRTTSLYIGDAYTDLTFAIGKLESSWYFQNSLYISEDMNAYVFEGDHDAFASIFKTPKPDRIISGCGSDIQLHSSKGAIGLRVDGVENLVIDTVNIHDIYNWADLGNSDWCGAYDGPEVGNEDIDIQYGYTGTRSHGIVVDHVTAIMQNIIINNIESYNGEANGLTVYKDSEVSLENINVDQIYAGTQLSDNDVDDLISPNLVPRACGVDIRPDTVVTINEDIGVFDGNDIVGYETCILGEVDESDTDETIDLIKSNIRSKTKHNRSRMSSLVISICLLLSIAIMFRAVVMGKNYFYSWKQINANGNSSDNGFNSFANLNSGDQGCTEYSPLL